jgi:hypothetical protein
MDFLFILSILQVCLKVYSFTVITACKLFLVTVDYNKYRSINKRIDVYTCNVHTVYTHDSAKYVYNIYIA